MNWVYMKGISIDAQYLYRRALEHLEQERYETALRYFRQAVVIAPGYSGHSTRWLTAMPISAGTMMPSGYTTVR